MSRILANLLVFAFVVACGVIVMIYGWGIVPKRLWIVITLGMLVQIAGAVCWRLINDPR